VEGLIRVPQDGRSDGPGSPLGERGQCISAVHAPRRRRVAPAGVLTRGETTSDEPENFDVEGAVNDYRSIMENLDAATSPEAKDKYRGMSQRARQKWKEWQGEDSLHELAFGELLELRTFRPLHAYDESERPGVR
jgi:hypothetical protein